MDLEPHLSPIEAAAEALQGQHRIANQVPRHGLTPMPFRRGSIAPGPIVPPPHPKLAKPLSGCSIMTIRSRGRRCAFARICLLTFTGSSLASQAGRMMVYRGFSVLHTVF